MKTSTVLVGLASVATYLILGTHGFVASGNLHVGVISSRTHDVSSSSSCAGSSSRPVFPTRQTPRRRRNDYPSLLMMAAAKKRRRRKADKGGGASAAASGASTASTPKEPANVGSVPGTGAGQLGDVLEGDRRVEELFTDDWSGMPSNTGMVKSNVSSGCDPRC